MKTIDLKKCDDDTVLMCLNCHYTNTADVWKKNKSRCKKCSSKAFIEFSFSNIFGFKIPKGKTTTRRKKYERKGSSDNKIKQKRRDDSKKKQQRRNDTSSSSSKRTKNVHKMQRKKRVKKISKRNSKNSRVTTLDNLIKSKKL